MDDPSHARRLLAIAAILDGESRSRAALLGRMERQTLRDWVHRYNESGPEGLKSIRSPGRPPKLDDQQRQRLARLIEGSQFPDINPRWRLADVVRLVRDEFGVELDEVSIGRLMRSLGYTFTGTRWRKSDSADDDGGDGSSRGKPMSRPMQILMTPLALAC